MNICSRHAIRVDNAVYPADSVELIPIIIHLLESAKAFGWRALRIVIPMTQRPVRANRHTFTGCGVYHKDISPPSMPMAILADVFRKRTREVAADIELSSGYKVRDMPGRFGRPLEEVVLAVITECFGRKRKSYDFQIRKGGGIISTARYVTMLIYTEFPHFFADVADFVKLTIKLCIRWLELNSLVAINYYKPTICTIFILHYINFLIQQTGKKL